MCRLYFFSFLFFCVPHFLSFSFFIWPEGLRFISDFFLHFSDIIWSRNKKPMEYQRMITYRNWVSAYLIRLRNFFALSSIRFRLFFFFSQYPLYGVFFRHSIVIFSKHIVTSIENVFFVVFSLFSFSLFCSMKLICMSSLNCEFDPK